MKNYEVTFIVDPVLSGDEIKATAQTYVDQIKGEGFEIIHVDEMGLRTLAYPINRKNSGVYFSVEFQGPSGKLIDKLELALRRDERIMRFLCIKLDKYGVKYNEDKRNGLIGKVKMKEKKSLVNRRRGNIRDQRRGGGRSRSPRDAEPSKSVPAREKDGEAIESNLNDPNWTDDNRVSIVPKTSTEVNTLTVKIEVTLGDHSLVSFSKSDEENVLRELRKILESDKLKLIKKRAGSVILTLEMNREDAEKLYLLIKTGGLEYLGIHDAKLKHFQESISSFSKKNESIDQFHHEIESIRILLKNRLVSFDIGTLAKNLLDILDFGSKKRNGVIVIFSRIKHMQSMKRNGTVDEESVLMESNRIVIGLLDLIDSLEIEDIVIKKMLEIIR